jgi:hypothetical protein
MGVCIDCAENIPKYTSVCDQFVSKEVAETGVPETQQRNDLGSDLPPQHSFIVRRRIVGIYRFFLKKGAEEFNKTINEKIILSIEGLTEGEDYTKTITAAPGGIFEMAIDLESDITDREVSIEIKKGGFLRRELAPLNNLRFQPFPSLEEEQNALMRQSRSFNGIEVIKKNFAEAGAGQSSRILQSNENPTILPSSN